MRIVEESIAALEAYGSVPIGFHINSKIRLDALIESSGRVLIEEPAEPRWKDYDAYPSECPAALPNYFDVSNWGVLSAYEGERRLGGAIVAWNTHGFDMLRGRSDLAVVADLRVHPDARGSGVGRGLFRAAQDWARSRGCVELNVETQETNVAACRFYAAMGCGLCSVEAGAYGPEIDEAKIIWGILL
jgi:GNAT superfamily N-acetyltransferase